MTFLSSLPKVTLVSLRDGLDLKTPTGRMAYGILASVASYETEVRTERQRAGIEAAREAQLPRDANAPGRLLGPL
jgi:DNA invertase Pin-like site-specific DNA recombinase